MAKTTGLRILVVEDDREWNLAIQSLFREQLRGAIVQGTRSGEEALQRLRSDRFDLLSLDINLSQAHPTDSNGNPDFSIPGYDGLDVLEKAAEWHACTGVVIISGLQHDEELRFIVQEEAKRLAVTMSPAAYLERYFPQHGLILFKSPDVRVDDSIKVFRAALTQEVIKALAKSPATRTLEPPYTITCDIREIPSRIHVNSRSKGRDSIEVREPADRFLLQEIIERQRLGTFVTDEEALQAFPDLSDAQIAIDGFRRRLKKLGIDPHRLISRVRSSRADCRGWEFHRSVKVRGAASVTKSGADPEFLPGGLDP